MDTILDLLQKSRLFCDVPEETLARNILTQGHIQEYSRDQFLISPGQQTDRFGLILSGRVQIMHLFANGSRSLMSVAGAGDFVGLDLVCTHSRMAPYHAMAAGSVCIFYLPSALLTEAGSLPDPIRLQCLERMLTMISQENMRKEYRLAILSRSGLRERITTYLQMQRRRRRENSFTIPFSREEMASFLCVNRSALSHELSLMQKEGLISFRKNRFTLNRLPEE